MLKKYRPARLVLGGKRPGQPWRPRRYSDLRSQNHRVRWSDRHVDGAKSKDTQRNRARADLRAHVHEAVSPARPPVSLRTYPPIRNPQPSCTTQGSRTFQSLPSRRPAATSRPPRETRSAALIRIFEVEPDTCPDCGEGTLRRVFERTATSHILARFSINTRAP